MLRSTVSLITLLSGVAALRAADPPAPNQVPFGDSIAAPVDLPYPGTLTLRVDATDVARGIFRVRETMPVPGPGAFTLLFPKWIPGKHRVFGPIRALAGLTITGGGKSLPWVRDDVEVYAFHVEVPPGVKALEIEFQYLSPTEGRQGRIEVTRSMLSLQWNSVSLYPAGYYARRIPVTATVDLPSGWTPATALDLTQQAGNSFTYKTTDYATLLDSPLLAGAYTRREQLAPHVWLDIAADEPKQLAATEEQLQFHRNLAVQAGKLFGGVHFDDYEFLLSLSDDLGEIGLEHQCSSEVGVGADYFTDWTNSAGDHDLLPHEFTHSWNGKYRRPAGLWTADFNLPMRDDLLWVYEGQTQYWGFVLAARSGLMTKEQVLEAFARIAAYYSSAPGRRWRTLADTTLDPIIAARQPKGWSSWQRGEDYYNEGLLLWLDADTLIRQLSAGERSLDDFARSFFGVHDGALGQFTYTFDDIVAALEAVQPYDWANFLHNRVNDISPQAPLDGLARGGYTLVFDDEPGAYSKIIDKSAKRGDFFYSLGIEVSSSGKVTRVDWDSLAFNAGITVASEIVAIEGRAYKEEHLKDLLKARHAPLELLVKEGDRYRTVTVNYDGGPRYPHLKKVAEGDGYLDRLLAPLE